MADRIITIADLCTAIAEGQITAAVDGTMYRISALELRRYLHQSGTQVPVLPTEPIASPTVSVDGSTSSSVA